MRILLVASKIWEPKSKKLIKKMTLIYRRITYSIFIIIFLIAAPTVILYTQGYRFNFEKGRIQKTGILVISSVPRRADIFLNGKKIENKTTPARLENILPADYEIKLAKNGYHDWNKRLTVLENSSTFAEKILLWKNSLPSNIINQDFFDYEPSWDRQQAAIITGSHQLILMDFSQNKTRELADLKQYSSAKIIGWSKSDKKIILKVAGKQETYLIFNTEVLVKEDPVIIPASYQTLKWDESSDNLVYGLKQKNLWQFDLFSKKEKMIAQNIIGDFWIQNNSLFYFTTTGLYKKLINKKSPAVLLDKNRCDGCRFLAEKKSRLFILDDNNQKLQIIDTAGKIRPIIAEAKNLDWLNNDVLLFYNNWELWIYDLNKKEPELITRVGEPLTQALWHTQRRHIIFTTDKKISIIELDNRELRNVITLANPEELRKITLDYRGRKIYFWGKQKDQTGLFELPLQ
jgi:hypothetical protein